jgi:hypothetical protein
MYPTGARINWQVVKHFTAERQLNVLFLTSPLGSQHGIGPHRTDSENILGLVDAISHHPIRKIPSLLRHFGHVCGGKNAQRLSDEVARILVRRSCARLCSLPLPLSLTQYVQFFYDLVLDPGYVLQLPNLSFHLLLLTSAAWSQR